MPPVEKTETREDVEYWTRFIEAIPDGVVVLQPSGLSRRANSATRMMLGFSHEQFTATPLHQLVHPHEEPGALCPLQQALQPENAWRVYSDTFTTHSGELLEVEICAWPREIHGQTASSTLTIQSRSFQKLKIAELQRSTRMANLGAHMAAVAHEYNNILMGIGTFASFVVRKGANDRQLLKAGEHIQDAVLRATEVTAEILRFARPTVLERRPIVVSTWLRELMVQLRGIVPASIFVRLDLHDEVIVEGDRTQLTQVVTNLMINARDAISGNGSISLRVKRSSEGTRLVKLEVGDSGAGISADQLERIFEPLFTTKGSAGTGLGLAVSRRIVEAHGGTIEVESEPGEGTCFIITLPEAAVALERRPVLVLIDDPSRAAAIVAFLSAFGFASEVSPGEGETGERRWLAVVAAASDSRDVLSREARRADVCILVDDRTLEDRPLPQAGVALVEGFDLSAILDHLKRADAARSS